MRLAGRRSKGARLPQGHGSLHAAGRVPAGQQHRFEDGADLLGLRLRGVVQDRRIPHHYLGDRPHPDADLEIMYCDPEEEADHAIVGGAPGPGPDPSPVPRQAPPPEPAPAAKPAAASAPAPAAAPDSDLSAVSIVTRPARPASAPLCSTSLSGPSATVPPLRVPTAA
ncbi:hypothetical protein JL100_023380 [Skermanella mucosa]|uniref:hypothetical protein n=1 Tax=Skermanella mucosa TaxID=1789672 RepID=UPI00192C3439|nr:hypothetical protein [Skermanella mucosa]UEM19991.1 hypothetical protein JL100_023380 [Skermanella mucosa]